MSQRPLPRPQSLTMTMTPRGGWPPRRPPWPARRRQRQMPSGGDRRRQRSEWRRRKRQGSGRCRKRWMARRCGLHRHYHSRRSRLSSSSSSSRSSRRRRRSSSRSSRRRRSSSSRSSRSSSSSSKQTSKRSSRRVLQARQAQQRMACRPSHLQAPSLVAGAAMRSSCRSMRAGCHGEQLLHPASLAQRLSCLLSKQRPGMQRRCRHCCRAAARPAPSRWRRCCALSAGARRCVTGGGVWFGPWAWRPAMPASVTSSRPIPLYLPMCHTTGGCAGPVHGAGAAVLWPRAAHLAVAPGVPPAARPAGGSQGR